MKKIIAKPVGMFELFYDLVFVYAISRITAVIHHPVSGSISVVTYLQFLLIVIVVMQIWLYQSLYFNRYSQNRFFDICGLLFNMFVAVYLANNINTNWHITFQYFNLAMIAMLMDLIMQYWLGVEKNKSNDNHIFILILGLELALVIIGILLGYDHGVYLAILGYLVGFLAPLVFYNKFNAKKVNFPHLVERASLIVIIAFGEAVVNLTSYFNNKTPLIYAISLFLSLTMMFASYVLFSEKVINHHQLSKGFVLMYSHVLLIIAILMMTATTIYLNLKEMNTAFLALFLTASMGLYYIALLLNGVYSKKSCKFNLKDLVVWLAIFGVGTSGVFVWQTNTLVIMLILFGWNLLYLVLLKIKSR